MFQQLRTLRFSIALATLALVPLTACGGGGGGGGAPVAGAPNLVSYSQNPIMATVAVPLAPVTPTVVGSVVSFSVAPPLPAGLTLNPLTGVITGTASGVSMPLTDFAVTATNADGSDALTVVVRVLAPPVVTAYTASPVTYEVGQAIAPNAPVKSGAVDSWSIAPALPLGLAFNTTTGVITGTPSVTSTSRNYAITATNADGSDLLQIELGVVPTILVKLEADRALARSDLLPFVGYTPILGGLSSNAPLLATDTSSLAGASLGGVTPLGAPTPAVNAAAPATGPGLGFQNATAAYSAMVEFVGTPPPSWTPACSILPPFDFIACSMAGFTVTRADIQAAALQARVFDTAGGPSDSFLTDALPVDHYEIAQVSDILPLGNDTLLSMFMETVDGRLVFRANNSLSATKLFVYEDAAGGSLEQLTNTRNSHNVSDGISSITGLVEMAGKLYFAADDGFSGGLRKLFQYDPTTNSLLRLSNTFPGGNDRPEEFAVHNGRLYFAARTPDDKKKLFCFGDGPLASVKQVSQINIPQKDDSPTWLTSYAGRLYFVAKSEASGAILKLFRFDDATGTIAQVLDITGAASTDDPRSLTVFDGTLYFTASSGASSISRKLFRYDAGTGSVAQVTNTAGTLYSDEVEDLTPYNGKLFFTASANSFGTLRKVFAYEPTGGGTVLRITDTAGPSSSDAPQYLVVLDNKLYFRASRSSSSSKLHCYDDMTATLRQLSNTSSSQAIDDDPRYLTAYGGKLYFSAWAAFAVSKLFVFDPQTDTLAQVSETRNDPALSDAPVPRVVFGEKLLFTSLDESARTKLFALCDRTRGCTLP